MVFKSIHNGGPEEIWQAVVDGGVTVLGAVPTLLAHLPAEDAAKAAPSLRIIIAWADAE